MMAKVSYERLTIQYDMGLYERALELVPSLTYSFKRLGMYGEALKCKIAEAMNLKALGRLDAASAVLEEMRGDSSLPHAPSTSWFGLDQLG